MRIVVCVKQVIDTAARIDLKGGKVETTGLARVLNPYDEYAVEEAIRIRERKPDTEITLVSVGPEDFRDVLRAGLAMGADKAVHLLDSGFDELDSLEVSRVLAQAVGSFGYDLILCGRQAVDDDMAQVGPALAVVLGIPCVTVVTHLNFSDDWQQAVITRQVEGGSEILESPLPVLLTCQKGLNQPRLPSLKGIMAAKRKEIKILDAAAIGFDLASVGEKSSKVAQSRLELPPSRGKGQVFEGPVEESVARLVKALRQDEKVV